MAVAVNVFRESVRDRVLYLIVLFAVLLLLGARLLPDLSAGAEFKLILDLGLGVIHLFGLVVAIFLGTSLLYKEIEKRTIYLLIAKPLDPAEFILGKHLGLAAVLAVLIALMSLCFAAVLAIGRVPAGGLAAALGLSVAFGYLELLVIVAAALFFGSFTSPVLASIFTISLYLVGHFTADLLNLGRLSKNAFSAQLTQFLYLILPNLERLNLRNGAVYGQLPPPGELALSGLYALLYTGLLLSLAVLIFARREF
ncbi:ABC-type transport system involved in multi-copper enzyme maturation, permease component [Gloeobacter kilaueensis JS1]|uniref:ABC-type transport system involved in multi-copper enzyme maturation, permease component n=2 Tax=Gloeobacter TaxID=33071 RepID=U5QBT5_GLOK1|nr:ABC-type transport system involved in multi-copper enzyme maturation, permease component [Gloeobacter kilaueensis JS1]